MLKPRLSWRHVAAGLLTLDILAVTLAFWLVYMARYRVEILPHRPQPTPLVIAVGVVTWIAALWAQRLYGSRQVGSGFSEYSRIVFAGTWSLAACLLMVFSLSFTISRAFLLVAWTLSTAFVLIGRFAARRVVRYLSKRGYRLRRVIVVGASPQGISLANELASNPAASADVIGFLDDYKPVGTKIAGMTVLGDAASLGSVSSRLDVTHAVVVTAALSWESWQSIMGRAFKAGPELLLAAGTFEAHANALEMAQLGGAVLVHPHASRIIGAEAALKRILDVALVGVALVVALPVAWLILLIRLAPRPWIVWQSVYGQGDRTLRIPVFTDARLWSWHLGRLPAAYRVLMGQMSVVGPRPIIVGNEQPYGSSHALLVSMKPGFVGPWWLVRRSGGDLDAEIAADLAYARSYTVWLDLVTLLQTALALFAAAATRTPPLTPGVQPVVAESRASRLG